MSLLINNDLIWVSVPKCASVSIEQSLLDSNLDITLFSEYKYNREAFDLHMHIRKSGLFTEFGRKETICVNRNWFDRWLSGLEYFWEMLNYKQQITTIKWEDMDNDFIIKTFNHNFSKTLYYDREKWGDLVLNLIHNQNTYNIIKITPFISVLLSENYWKENEPCTYEFDIKEIDKFEEFISNRYGVNFEIKHLNKTKKTKNKIEINDELKNHIWNVFEKPFQKRNTLI